MRHSEKKMRHGVKKRKTGPLIVLVLEIMVIIVMHAVKINKLSPGARQAPAAVGQLPAGMQQFPAGMQQFPAGRVLSVTPKPPRHVPELFEDRLAAAAETKIIFFY
jgi:hypothetical protein